MKSIIELANQAELGELGERGDCVFYQPGTKGLQQFAHLVRQQALEEAAGVVEDMDVQHPKYIAAAIRALKGETK
jgi:hypothetical protein